MRTVIGGNGRVVALAFILASIASAADPSAWESFFLHNVRATELGGIGLDVNEMRSVVGIIGKYNAAMQQLNAASPSVLNRRLDAVRAEEPAAAIEHRSRDLEARRLVMVNNHVERLRTALGLVRFQFLDEYVAAWHKATSMPPPRSLPDGKKK
jgi:hypothetical protein